MTKLLLLLSCTFICAFVYAQNQPYRQWKQLYGGTQTDSASCIIQTKDGGYLVGGTTSSTTRQVTGTHGRHDIWLVKINPDGMVQWTKALGGSLDDFLGKLVQTSDGGYAIAATTLSKDFDVPGNHGYSDAWIVKLDGSGNIQWSKTYGSSKTDGASGILQTADSGYLFAGYSGFNSGDVTGNHGGSDVWVVKLSNSGSIQWQKSYGGSNSEQAMAVKQTTGGGYVVAANTMSVDGDVTGLHGASGRDYWILNLDSTGNLNWQKTYGGSKDELPTDVIQTTSGGYLITGCSNSTDGDITGHHGDTLHSDMWIVNLNSDGSLNWQSSLGWNDNEYAAQVTQMNDSSILIGGWTNDTTNAVSASYHPGFILMNLNGNGQLNWQKAFVQDSCFVYGTVVTKDNGFIMTGKFVGINGIGNGDYEVMKLSPYSLNTNILIAKTHPGGNCYSGSSIKCSLRKGGPYTVQLYNYGVLYDSATNVTDSFTFKNVSEGMYYATAKNSTSYSTTTITSLLPPPSGIFINSLTSGNALLNWNKLDCADYFEIKYRVKGTKKWIYKYTDSNVYNYLLPALKPATTYIVRMIAHKSTAYSPVISVVSDSVVFTTLDTNILYAEDFEAPNVDKNIWLKEAIDTGNAVITSTDVARKNKKAAKFSFNFSNWTDVDSLQPEGHRTELHPRKGTVPGRFNLDTGYWIGLSDYFPSSWQTDPTPTIVWQFHGNTDTDSLGGGSNQPALYASINSNKTFINIQVINDSGNLFSIGNVPIIENQWNDWVMHIKFSYASGFDTIWLNGTQVAAYAGSNFYHVAGQLTDIGPYLKVGLYKPNWGDSGITGQASNLTMYDDDIIIGNNKATYNQLSSYFGTTPLVNQSLFAATSTTNQLAVASSVNTGNMLAYPNPAHDNITVRFTAERAGKYSFALTDVSGRLLQTKTIDAVNGINNINIDVSSYTQGMYMIMLTSSGDKKRTVKFIKE